VEGDDVVHHLGRLPEAVFLVVLLLVLGVGGGLVGFLSGGEEEAGSDGQAASGRGRGRNDAKEPRKKNSRAVLVVGREAVLLQEVVLDVPVWLFVFVFVCARRCDRNG
jgi:hypothetical protein